MILVPFRTYCLILASLHAGQPINGYGTAGGVAPELDELLDGEDTSEVLDASAILSMAAFELVVGHWVPGDPADVGYTDNVAVQISLEDTSTAWCRHCLSALFIAWAPSISSGLDLGGFLQVFGMGVHLGQNSADPQRPFRRSRSPRSDGLTLPETRL